MVEGTLSVVFVLKQLISDHVNIGICIILALWSWEMNLLRSDSTGYKEQKPLKQGQVQEDFEEIGENPREM